jgi:hypothetical protein
MPCIVTRRTELENPEHEPEYVARQRFDLQSSSRLDRAFICGELVRRSSLPARPSESWGIGTLRFGCRALLGYFPAHQRSKLMRVFLAAAIAVSLVTLAHAQSQNVPQYGEEDKPKTQVQKDADTAAERAYQRSLGSIPEKGSNDPWGTVRSNDAPKNSVARTPAAKTKTKAGSASAKAASPN